MHRNKFWLGFLAFCAAVTLWYSGSALYKLFQYYRLTDRAPLVESRWAVKKISEEIYVLTAAYSFKTDGQLYQGESKLIHDYYRNQWGAEQAIGSFSKRYDQAWYAPANPHVSSLQKIFPAKECISAAVLWGLLLYFIWLGFYVVRYHP